MNKSIDNEATFADFLAEFAKGSTNQMLTERMRDLVKACTETGNGGSITLKIAVKASRGVAELRAKVNVSKPEPALPGGAYFTTDDGALVDEDPRQLKLPVGKVIEMQPVKNINKDS